ncbi:hypothetical protein, partial [Candidatus Pelagibacter sp. HIMB1748]|uniref:hypothetical protein n=1 Tax=Candidatus Pelagibacter sp. HIMB1748 TaxID=3413371 RepID=UPI003F836B4A
MSIEKKIINIIKSNFGFFLFLLFFVILFRDFLYTYKIQLEKFLPYYAYQDQIMYYLTGDDKFDIEAPMNLRFLGLWIQYLIFKIIPCVELAAKIKLLIPYENYTCVTFSSALMNYLSLCGILSLTFSYCHKKLNLDISESILTVLLTYIYIDHVEAFTLDRISILYLLTILYFLDKKKIAITLILFSAIVNEKIIFVLGGLFFIRLFFNNKNYYKEFFITTLFSALLALTIFLFYSTVLQKGYFQSDLGGNGLYDTVFSNGLDRILAIFLSKSGFSNGLLPLILAILPYLISIRINTSKFFFSKLDLLIPISLLAFTAGGGMEQTGRYVMYSMPLWLPIFSQQLLYFLKKE